MAESSRLLPVADDRFRELRGLPAGSPEHTELRRRIIESHLPLVHQIARGFRGRGASMEELVQVGAEALVMAVDRFDPERGCGFPAYAYPTVTGAMKRYFRDFGWSIRPPRRLQELRTGVMRARPLLAQRLGRSPSADDIAAELGVTVPEVRDALEANETYSLLSLDRPHTERTDGEELSLHDQLGADDRNLLLVDDREALGPAMSRLPKRERTILLLRFYGNRTQREIAEELGLSQMHVSRLIKDSCGRLRRTLTADA